MGGGAKGRTQSKGSTATTTDIAVDRNLHIVLCRYATVHPGCTRAPKIVAVRRVLHSMNAGLPRTRALEQQQFGVSRYIVCMSPWR